MWLARMKWYIDLIANIDFIRNALFSGLELRRNVLFAERLISSSPMTIKLWVQPKRRMIVRLCRGREVETSQRIGAEGEHKVKLFLQKSHELHRYHNLQLKRLQMLWDWVSQVGCLQERMWLQFVLNKLTIVWRWLNFDDWVIHFYKYMWLKWTGMVWICDLCFLPSTTTQLWVFVDAVLSSITQILTVNLSNVCTVIRFML